MKNILVHIDASPRSEVRLTLAQQLAARHEAELTVLYGVLPAVMAAPWALGEGIAAAAEVLADMDREQRDRAHAVFEQASHRGPVHWLDGRSSPHWTLLQRAPYQDLLVLGQADASDALTGALPPDFVSDVIADTGRPTLVVPSTGAYTGFAKHVLIAWKPSREAARAVTAALPLLHRAATIDVAIRPDTQPDELDHGVELERWLRGHGIAGTIRRHRLGTGDVGEGLLSVAADTDAELLVMGCYGHSRTREWVLGGVSRTILRTMTLPVLLAH